MLLNLVILGVVIYVLAPQLDVFHRSLSALSDAKLDWVMLAVVAVGGMYLAATSVYIALARHRLRYRRTLLVQMASLFASKLLPAGIGPIGINYEYLRKSRHTQVQAGSVVAMNNLVGFVANGILLALVLIFARPSHIRLSWLVNGDRLEWVIAGVVLTSLLVVIIPRVRRTVAKILVQAAGNARLYRAHPLRVVVALIAAAVLLLCHTLCLYASAHAVGMNLGYTQALVALSVEVVGATVTPTPGGLGGAEATLTAVLVALGFASGISLAVALMFRLITYWLALFIGAGAFAYVQRARYI